MVFTEEESKEFDRLCSEWISLYGKLHKHPKGAFRLIDVDTYRSQFKSIYESNYLHLLQVAKNCEYKKHNNPMCDVCSKKNEKYFEYSTASWRNELCGWLLKYVDTDSTWVDSKSTDYYLLKRPNPNGKTSILEKRVMNLRALRGHVAMLKQILNAEKAKDQSLFWIRLGNNTEVINWLLNVVKLPLEIVYNIIGFL